MVEVFALLMFVTSCALTVYLVMQDKKYKDEKSQQMEALSAVASTLVEKSLRVDQLENHQQMLKQIHNQDLQLLKQNHKHQMVEAEKEIRADANRRSRATMRGQATEHLAPLMMENFNPKDFRFMGDPIDYLVCVGSSAIHDKTGDTVDEVILLDIKTGKADLSKVQRRIRDAVVEGRVSFMTYNSDTETIRRWPDDLH